ncbi:hypothetical protein RUM44_013500 [Polyplax serrata]|uniref:Uncharacterized protein n=1 Tax=Polyplax serrata TaxID=468196 RepID=A0ABR1BGJ2_POLSC
MPDNPKYEQSGETLLDSSVVGNKDLRTACLQQKMNVNREEYNHPFNEFIDNRCRQLSQTKTGRDSAFHLAEWMKDNWGNTSQREGYSESNSRFQAQEARCRKMIASGDRTSPVRTVNNSKSDELDWFNQRSESKKMEICQSASEGQITSKSGDNQERTVSVCRQCHKTCFNSSGKKHCLREDLIEDLEEDDEEDDEDENVTSGDEAWGPLMMLGMCGILPAMKTSQDPFAPIESPTISILPPTPDKKIKSNGKTEMVTSTFGESKKSENVSRTTTDRMTTCQKVTTVMSTTPSVMKPKIQITKMVDSEDEGTPGKGSPYKSLSSSPRLRRFGTLSSLEKVTSDVSVGRNETTTGAVSVKKGEVKAESGEDEDEDDDDDDEGGDEDSDKIEVKSHPLEVGDSIRGWTVRAGSFVAAKMAFFERLSSPDNSVTVRKTTFLERYFKPSGENNLESSDVGTNASSLTRDDEGETSGATSGEEVWGTPTSGGDFDDDLAAESGTFSIFESPRGSIGPEDDTEQLMDDLLMSLPVLSVRTRGISPKRRLETLMEEDDSELSSTPCSPKVTRDVKPGQDRVLHGSQGKQLTDGVPKVSSNAIRQQSARRTTMARPKVGNIDRALGIHSDEEEVVEDRSSSPSLLRRLGLKKNSGRQNEPGKKCNKILGFLSSKKMNTTVGSRNSAIYGAKPLFRYLFNKDSDDDDDDDDDDIPTTLQKGLTPYRRNEKRLEKRFWKQLRKRRSSTKAATVG